jgi:hypothetical protein
MFIGSIKDGTNQATETANYDKEQQFPNGKVGIVST